MTIKIPDSDLFRFPYPWKETDILWDGVQFPNPSTGPFYNEASRREGGFYFETGPTVSADGGWDFGSGGEAIILLTGTGGTNHWSLVWKCINGIKYDREQIGRFRVFIQQDVNQRIWLAVCNYVPDDGALAYTGVHIGFHVTDNLIRGSVADGTTQATVDLQTFTGSFIGTMEYRRYRERVEFYINDVLKGVIRTNLPSGAGAGLRVTATNYVNAVNRIVQVWQMMYWQGKE
jgi:hypothetical protein